MMVGSALRYGFGVWFSLALANSISAASSITHIELFALSAKRSDLVRSPTIPITKYILLIHVQKMSTPLVRS
jgi:hypothetical protein